MKDSRDSDDFEKLRKKLFRKYRWGFIPLHNFILQLNRVQLLEERATALRKKDAGKTPR